MKPVPLANATRRLAAPQTWNHETEGVCHTLEILDRDGVMISAWAPSVSERDRIALGAPIFLHIHGTSHPVVGFTIGEVPK